MFQAFFCITSWTGGRGGHRAIDLSPMHTVWLILAMMQTNYSKHRELMDTADMRAPCVSVIPLIGNLCTSCSRSFCSPIMTSHCYLSTHPPTNPVVVATIHQMANTVLNRTCFFYTYITCVMESLRNYSNGASANQRYPFNRHAYA